MEPSPLSGKSRVRNSILRTGSQSNNAMKVTFDEEIIAEHDKFRGTRMKIDEPKTPFHYFDEEGNEVQPPSNARRNSVDINQINQQLQQDIKKFHIRLSDEGRLVRWMV